jgi:predicted MFS family arabinose efflux permease
MPTPVHSEARCRTRSIRDFGGLYAALILLSFHWALVIYVNSSFLDQFFNEHTVSMLYTVSALLSILCFLFISRMLKRMGNLRLAIGFSILELIAVFMLPFASSPLLIGLLFIIHQTIVPLILFSLDIFMESLIGDCERETGGRRGLFLTIMSLTIALSALLSGYLIGDSTPHFELVYITSALLLIPFIFLVLRSFKTFKDKVYEEHALSRGIFKFWHARDIRNVFFAHFTLQLFFAWMVIYTPIYLNTKMGFDWEQIGQILFIGLMAYVFLEYVVGIIADRWLGEKEMMVLGFFIITIATSWFTFLTPESIGLWIIAMFMTRVGASLIETTTESYFFKHTNGNDTALISFFRITRPLSIVVGALLGSLTLSFLPMELLFTILALLMIPGLFFTMALKDTK